jgi:hypothetical protein
MLYLFIDESGDLGFSEGSSRWFVFTVVLVRNKRQLEKVIRKVRKGLKKKYRYVHELHAYHADEITRKRVLQLLAAKEDLAILSVILNKDKVYIDLQSQKNYLYNYTTNILIDRFYTQKVVSEGEVVQICIDRKDSNKNIRENFIEYLRTSLSTKRTDYFTIILRASHEEKSLQAVDFISWAIFRKYERNDYEYYEIIKDKILEENIVFP